MSNQSDEIEVMQMHSNEVLALREKVTVDIAVSTAHAFPRNLQKCLDNALFTATIDVETASTCWYAVPRAGKSITGPSVHLAKIIMQTWGNFRAEAKVIEETRTHVVSEAVAWDLETNVAVKVTVKRSISTKTGRMTDDMIIVTGNAANSISLRNAVFSVVPRAITDKVYKATQQKIIGEPSKFSKRLKDVLVGYKKTHNKEEAEVLGLVGKTHISQITPDDLVVIIGTAQSIKDGDTTVELAFGVNKDQKQKVEDRKEDLKTKQEASEKVKKQQEEELNKDLLDEQKKQSENNSGSGLFDAKNSMP